MYRQRIKGFGMQVSCCLVLLWTGIAQAESLKFEAGTVLVDGTPQNVWLMNTDYSNPIIVCTVQYNNSTTPVVVRISARHNDHFTLYLQNPSGGTPVQESVSYLVVEQGSWTIDGVKIDAGFYLATVTDEDESWVGSQAEPPAEGLPQYVNDYTDPVVLGQVMSVIDPLGRWSTFWCQGSDLTDPPSATALVTGKTACEDTDVVRAPEHVAYIVFNTGHGTLGSVEYEASVGSNSIQGVGDQPPYAYTFDSAFSIAPTIVVASMAGVNDTNGGWAQTYGAQLASTTELYLAIDEDQIGDAERSHATERVGYLAFSKAFAYPECSTDADCDDGNDCTGDTCAGGWCQNPPHPAGTACGDPSDTICTDPDTCTGTGACQPNNAPGMTPCPDDLFCNGNEKCLGGVCIAGYAHCPEPLLCDEVNDCCVGCFEDADCTGGFLCCFSGTCDATCQECCEPADCDDENECTDDTCVYGMCVFTPKEEGTPCGDPTDNPPCNLPDSCDAAGVCLDNEMGVGAQCDNGIFCDGDAVDFCSESLDCVPDPEAELPCQEPLRCDEVNKWCVDCFVDTDCPEPDQVCCEDSEGKGICVDCCGDEDCPVGEFCCDDDDYACHECCDNADCPAEEPNCCDDGACYECCENADCPAEEPNCCSDGACYECCSDCDCQDPEAPYCVGNVCVECRFSLQCKDGNSCTDDRCIGGSCSNPPFVEGHTCQFPLPLDIDCDPVDICDGAGNCIIRLADAGTPCGDPSDTICTDPDTCDGYGTCKPRHAPNLTSCADELFCNGDERCFNGVCGGHDPCPEPLLCDEENDCCVECFESEDCTGDLLCCLVGTCDASCGECCENADCDDGNDCTDDTCNSESWMCSFLPKANGVPCGDDTDNPPCNLPDKCDGEGTCLDNELGVGAQCDNGIFCDGDAVDHCDEYLDCVPDPEAPEPCSAPAFCDEEYDRCCECLVDVDCDQMDTECSNPDTCTFGVDSCTCQANDEPSGTSCGDHSDTDCTNPDTCDGVGACAPNHAWEGTICHDGSDCNGADTCDDNGNCSVHIGDECPEGSVCCDATGGCEECCDDDDCPGDLVCCDFTCVACCDDSDCSGATPACRTTTHTCVECTDTNESACGPLESCCLFTCRVGGCTKPSELDE